MAAGESGTLMYLKVSPDAKKELPRKQQVTGDLPKFATRRPCYIPDLRKANVEAEDHHTLELPVGDMGEMMKVNMSDKDTLKKTFTLMVKWDGDGQTFTHIDPLSPPLTKIQVAKVYELAVSGIKYHPLHIHVMPYQIVKDGKKLNEGLIPTGNYFQDGDWHDVLLSPGHNKATLRFMPERFTGRYLVHCHILEHEDNGMMAYIEVDGDEGTLCPEAKKTMPDCFREDDPQWGYKLIQDSGFPGWR